MKKNLLILALCTLLPSWGQELLGEAETLHIQTNTQQVLPGEYLYYSLRLQHIPSENRLEQGPEVAYVALADANGKVQIVQQMLLAQKENLYVGQGELFIPTSLPTGGYSLLGYTPNMLQDPHQKLPQTPIALLNPYSTARATAVIELKTNANTPSLQNNQLKDLDFTAAKTNEWIPFSVPENLPKNGLFELSVKKISSLQSQAFFTSNEQQTEDQSPKNKQPKKITVPSGAAISGRLVSSTEPVNRIGVSLSFIGENMPFKMTTTDAQGRFSFPLWSTINSPQGVLQIWNDKASDIQMVLDPLPTPPANRIEKAALHLLASDLEQLRNRSIHNQIESAFNSFKQDSIPLENAPMSRLDAYEMSSYLLDDYSRFKSFEETVFEIISELSYKKTASNSEVLFVKNVTRNVATPALPLLLLDGIPVSDQNAFRRYPAAEIERISVSKQQIVMGDRLWNGLVSVQSFGGIPKTYLSQQSIKIWELDLPRLKKKYYQQPKMAPNNIPNFAHTLVWLPNQHPKELQEFRGFKSPHMEGLFKLTIQGKEPSGKVYYYQKVYDVKVRKK